MLQSTYCHYHVQQRLHDNLFQCSSVVYKEHCQVFLRNTYSVVLFVHHHWQQLTYQLMIKVREHSTCLLWPQENQPSLHDVHQLIIYPSIFLLLFDECQLYEFSQSCLRRIKHD